MSVFKYMNPNYWGEKKFEKRMKNFLRGVSNEMEFNPLTTNLVYKDNSIERYSKRLYENKAWYSGEITDLSYFYTKVTYQSSTRQDADYTRRKHTDNSKLLEQTWFWAKSFADSNSAGVDNHIRYTIGVAPKIPSTMATLCIGNGYTNTIEYEDQIEGEETEELEERYDYILRENQFDKLLRKAYETESWAGGFAFKISFNPAFDTPILEVVNPMNYKPKVVANRIVEDIFQKYYYKEAVVYRLSESYGVDPQGSYIRYTLHKTENMDHKDNTLWEQVNVKDIPETSHLKDVHIKGYFKKLSIYKPNKSVNNVFLDSVMGESDYTGSYAALNDLDEAFSAFAQELRDGRLQKYMPDTLADFDADGNSTHSDFLRTTHIILKGGIGADSDDKVEWNQAQIDINKAIERIKQNYQIIFNNAGLSPLTFGITGLEAMNAGEASQQEREKVSIRTRNDKTESMEPTLEYILSTLFDIDQIIQVAQKYNGNIPVGSIRPAKVIFKHNDYIIKTSADRTKEVTEGLQYGAWDLKNAIDYVHEDKSDEEKILMRVNSKIERGINVFTKEEELVYLEQVNQIEEEVTEEIVEEEATEEVLEEEVLEEEQEE